MSSTIPSVNSSTNLAALNNSLTNSQSSINTNTLRIEDIIAPYLPELKSRSIDIRYAACNRLEQYLEISSRDLSYTAFHSILNGVNKYVFTLVNSVDTSERLAGIALMCMLVNIVTVDIILLHSILICTVLYTMSRYVTATAI